MTKSCGNCSWWTKVKTIKGICDLHDYGWANSDHGRGCPDWVRIKDYKPRVKTVRLVDIESYF